MIITTIAFSLKSKNTHKQAKAKENDERINAA